MKSYGVAVAKRPERDRIRPERAVAGVRNVHAVNDVRVLEAGDAPDTDGLATAGGAARADAGREI